ncbi:sensor histidine kinase [Actinokineospora diospyrosa]
MVGLAGNYLRDDHSWRLSASAAAGLVLGAALVLRRRFPVAVFGVIAVVSLTAAALGVLWDPFLALSLALYAVVVALPQRKAAIAAATGGGVVVAAVLLSWSSPWTYVAGLPLLGIAWVSGRAVQSRQEQTARFERQREERILADERLRIAREVHDVLTHGMGLIAVRSGVALHIAREWPEEARETVRVIEETSRHALAEMRRLLHMLREDADLAPAPGLAGLAELAERAAMAEVEVALSVAAEDVPESVGLNAYRIVQEALTNVVKHAAPARCRVSVTAEDSEVRIEVADDGSRPVPAERRRGHGLVGMEERVALYGGEFSAGPRPEGGFLVRASLPYRTEGDT